MDNQLWSWLLTIVGVTGFILAGRKVWWAWYVNLACQILWFAYAIITQQWGFIVAALVYSVVFTQNAIKWTRERRKEVEKAQSDLEDWSWDRTIDEWEKDWNRNPHAWSKSNEVRAPLILGEGPTVEYLTDEEFVKEYGDRTSSSVVKEYLANYYRGLDISGAIAEEEKAARLNRFAREMGWREPDDESNRNGS